MIPAPVARAIVEILDASGTLGTGFLVGPDLVLTAKHVVGARAALRVRFPTVSAPTDATLAEALPAAADWALLRVADVPPAVSPLPLGVTGNVADEVAWYSIGYTRLRGGLRGAFHGVVRALSNELELYCDELEGSTYGDARGLSGGPCIVDGEAIGLITDVLRRGDNGAIVAGQVHALPLETLRPASGAFPQLGGKPLPWELVFKSALEGLKAASLEIAADEVRLANPVVSDRLPGQIARRMINQGVKPTARVLRQLRDKLTPETRDVVMGAAETLWVDGTAAESLAAVVENGRIGALATDLDWSARHHLARAYACHNRGAVPWTHVVIDVDHEEPFEVAVLAKAFDELDKAVGGGGDRAAVKRRVADEPRTTVFVVAEPRTDVVAALRTEFPKLVIVFLSRATPSAAAANPIADAIAPAPARADETSALTHRADAQALLRKP